VARIVYLASSLAIRIFNLNLSDKPWVRLEKIYSKIRGASQTKANVTQLAWNKEGK
jgi:hypothetical protein